MVEIWCTFWMWEFKLIRVTPHSKHVTPVEWLARCEPKSTRVPLFPFLGMVVWYRPIFLSTHLKPLPLLSRLIVFILGPRHRGEHRGRALGVVSDELLRPRQTKSLRARNG